MPAAIKDIRPDWVKPENASVLDSPVTKAIRILAGLIPGVNHPQDAVMGMMAPMDVGPAGGMAGAIQKVIKAFHGSPHDFDQFAMDKIGTGEGAQAYGHGLYFAENPQVAEDYRRTLAAPTADNPAWRLSGEPVATGTDHWQIAQLLHGSPDGQDMATFLGKRIAELEDQARFAEKAYGPDAASMYRMQADRLRKIDPAELTYHRPGRTYEVAIKADPEHFLDWDKPLSQQHPQVQESVSKARAKIMGDVRPVRLKDGSYGVTRINADGSGNVIPGVSEATPEAAVAALDREAGHGTGQWAYDSISRTVRKPGAFPELSIPDKAAAANVLKEHGIPGIKYLDQGSRPTNVVQQRLQDLLEKHGGDAAAAVDEHLKSVYDPTARTPAARQALIDRLKPPSRNYVVFDDKLVEILKKYGIAAPVIEGLRREALRNGGKADITDIWQQ